MSVSPRKRQQTPSLEGKQPQFSAEDAEKVATNLSKGAFARGLENLARKDGSDKPVIGADARTQSEKFEAAARELGCDPDEDRFKSVLRKLAKPKN